jgi:hypothetical protein
MVPVAEASTFADEEVLDVPGRPRVIHAPGHTCLADLVRKARSHEPVSRCDLAITMETYAEVVSSAASALASKVPSPEARSWSRKLVITGPT